MSAAHRLPLPQLPREAVLALRPLAAAGFTFLLREVRSKLGKKGVTGLEMRRKD